MSHVAMAHIHISFAEHISNYFRVIAKNVPLPFKHGYKRSTLLYCSDVIGYVTMVKYIFPSIACMWSFRGWSQFKAGLYWIFCNFPFYVCGLFQMTVLSELKLSWKCWVVSYKKAGLCIVQIFSLQWWRKCIWVILIISGKCVFYTFNYGKDQN